MEAIRAALADEAKAQTDVRALRPSHVWLVVAMALAEIDRIVEANRGRRKDSKGESVYDRIAEKLRKASGFEELSGESVRQYRSSIKRGKYDAQLAKLGLRRVGNRIEPIDTAANQVPAAPAANQTAAAANPLPDAPKPHAPAVGSQSHDHHTSIRLKQDPE
jgi:uncharacterized protein with PIN domain